MNVLLANKTSKPAIQTNDLLLTGSGLGTTSTIVKAAKKAAAAGALTTQVVLVPTTQKQDYGGNLDR